MAIGNPTDSGFRGAALTREQQYVWPLLDTFDWYGPRYENRRKHGFVAELVRKLGLEVMAARPGIVTARKPG